MFLNHLYGGMDEPELKIIDVFVCKLRKKIGRGDGRRQLHSKGLGTRLRAKRPAARYGNTKNRRLITTGLDQSLPSTYPLFKEFGKQGNDRIS